jgi:cellulase
MSPVEVVARAPTSSASLVHTKPTTRTPPVRIPPVLALMFSPSGITINIYQNSVPNNGGQPYTIPGPPVLRCPAGGAPAPTSNSTPAPTATAAPLPSQPAGGAALYGQCGGTGWTGATSCAQGTCKVVNDWYSTYNPVL